MCMHQVIELEIIYPTLSYIGTKFLNVLLIVKHHLSIGFFLKVVLCYILIKMSI